MLFPILVWRHGRRVADTLLLPHSVSVAISPEILVKVAERAQREYLYEHTLGALQIGAPCLVQQERVTPVSLPFLTQ